MRSLRFVMILLPLIITLACNGGASSAPTVLPPSTATRSIAPTLEAPLRPSPTRAGERSPSPTAQATPTPEEANPCQNPYYPIVQGASWQYQMNGFGHSGTSTRTITSVRTDGFEMQDTLNTGVTHQYSWTCQNGNLTGFTASALVVAPDVQGDTSIESNQGISFPANPQPGQEWTQNIVYRTQVTAGGTTVEARNEMTIVCRAGGMERVTVPAGGFSALRVDCLAKVDIHILDTVLTVSVSRSDWYAPAVGLVKSSGSSEMGAFELSLLAYHIP